MDKSCKQCGATVKRAGMCSTCRSARRQKQWRQNTQAYRDKGRRSTVSVSQELLRVAQTYGSEVRLIPDKPIPSRRTPRGPDEGCSTTSLELQAHLDRKAAEAADDPWWEDNPDALADV